MLNTGFTGRDASAKIEIELEMHRNSSQVATGGVGYWQPTSMKLLIASNRMRYAAALSCALLLCVVSFECVAQTRAPAKAVLPRVGTIKDYPATGLMTGCGNLYFYPASRPGASDDPYVFLARGDGGNAWMNLGGHDVRLRQIRLTRRGNQKPRPYYYRFGKVRITVLFEAFKPEDGPAEEGDSMFKMKITLRKGRAVRIVRAVGGSDC
jgi:hypothetical protein